MAKKEKVNRDFLSPPLQFAGNKKAWAAELMDEALLLPSGCTVWDCFGGSGVCARAVKNAGRMCMSCGMILMGIRSDALMLLRLSNSGGRSFGLSAVKITMALRNR